MADEPKITALVTGLARMHGGKAEGLDHKLKGEDSLARKIQSDVSESAAAGKPLSAAEVADKLFDVNRYTITYPDAKYADSAQATIDQLKKQGYTLKVKNYWNVKDNPYQGINVQATGKDGQKFELQFHTPESLSVKEGELHKVYEDHRISTNETAKRVLTQKMHAISAKIPVPSDVHSVS